MAVIFFIVQKLTYTEIFKNKKPEILDNNQALTLIGIQVTINLSIKKNS